jgi:hypothetical protein
LKRLKTALRRGPDDELASQAKLNNWTASTKAKVGQDKADHNDKANDVNDSVHGF